MQQYDHTYCSDQTLNTSYALDYCFWSKIVNGDALGKFNECMRIVTPHTGLIYESASWSGCSFSATVKFVPSSNTNQQYALKTGRHDIECLLPKCSL
jgi:hypothetical protein